MTDQSLPLPTFSVYCGCECIILASMLLSHILGDRFYAKMVKVCNLHYTNEWNISQDTSLYMNMNNKQCLWDT